MISLRTRSVEVQNRPHAVLEAMTEHDDHGYPIGLQEVQQ